MAISFLTNLNEEEFKAFLKQAVKEVWSERPGNTQAESPEILDIKQAADFLRLKVNTLYEKTSRKSIPHFKKGNKLYFCKRAVNGVLSRLSMSSYLWDKKIMRESSDQLRERMFSLVEQCRNNNTKRIDFCKEHNISMWKYMYWQEKYFAGKGKSKRNKFIPVKTEAANTLRLRSINLHFPNGVRLELPSGMSVSEVRALSGVK